MTNMSVIIRLQNLPWSANAADIRAYFHGLSIPEGGVHIVGGEQGDAFIAFSTDEDARQAMLLDGGKLKEIKIKLYLSSRTEMLKVIEQARQQAIKLQSLITANPLSAVPAPPQPPVNMIPKEEIKEPSAEESNKVREKDDDSNKRDKKERSSSRDKSRSGRGKDGERTRDRSRNRDRRDRERDRRRRDRSRSRDRYRSRRSRSRDRRRSGREESKESHRGSGAAPVGRRSRESEDDKNELMAKNESNQSWDLQQQPMSQTQLPSVSSKPPLLPDPPALPQMLLQMQQNGKDTMPPNLSNPPLQAPIINYVSADPDRRQFPGAPHMPQMANFGAMPPIRMREGWPGMAGPMGPLPVHLDPSQLSLQRPPLLMPDMPLPTFPPQGFPGQSVYSTGTDSFDHPMWRMMAHQQEVNHDNSATDSCIEIRGLPLNVSYIDVKKLFDGLTIPSDGIKMINDTQGNRTGIAYVKFLNSAQKKSALNQNGKKVRSNVVEVLHLRDDIYRTAVDNYKPEKDSIIKEVDMDIDNGESNDVIWTKDNRRDNRGGGGRERKFQDPYRINPAMQDYKRQDPRQEGRQDPRSNRAGDRSDRSERDSRSERPDKADRPPRFDRGERMDRTDRQDRLDNRRSDRQNVLEMSNSILIKNLPDQCNERDILDFFSELGIAPSNIHLMQDSVGQPSGEAYCQFENEEEADKAATKNGANMGRLVVSVEKISQEDYDLALGVWEPPHSSRQMYNSVPPLLPVPPEYHYRSAHHDEKESDRSSYGEDERYDKKNERGGNRGNYGMNDRYGPRMGGNNSGGMRGGREGRGRGRSRFSGGPPPPPLLGNNSLAEPQMPGPLMGGQRGQRGGGYGGGNSGAGGPYIDGDVVDNFGKPGCVVALENLHFRADIEEIIGLFSNFEVEHEDVIRRFDERGRPTGDARVSLKSPAEAMRAVRELQYSQLRGRTVKVSLLQN